MKYTDDRNQGSLFQLGLLKVELPYENEFVKMAEEIDWEAMIDIVGKKYSEKKGRNSKSLRMMIALEIAKRKLRLSDRDIVEQLKVDISLKHFCGFDSFHHDIPDASSLVYFRRRLDSETLQQMEEVNVKKIIRKVPLRKRHQVITDTTCVPANITYPTDSKLLSKTWEQLTNTLKKIRGAGTKLIIRGKRKVKSAIRSFNLKRKKTRHEIAKMNTFLMKAGKKLVRHLEEHLVGVREDIRAASEEVLSRARMILEQQKVLSCMKVRRIGNRIVSFHEQTIRPIFRGKEKQSTEFGPKVALSVIGGALVQTTKLENHNFSDTEMIDTAIRTHQRTFARLPSEINADRGAHAPRNHDQLKEAGILDGIQYRGKIPKHIDLPPPKSRKRMQRQRSIVEGKIGTFKTRYQGDRNRYANKNAHCWVSFGFITMNATWAASH